MVSPPSKHGFLSVTILVEPFLGFHAIFKWFRADTLLETNMETQRGPMKTTVLLKWGCMGFHVSLGECRVLESRCGVTVVRCELNQTEQA